jgi:hypothetical protein
MGARKRLTFAACLIAASWALPRSAAGQSGGPSDLSDPEIERRVAFVERSLEANQLHAQIWFWSWLTVNAASTVGLSVGAALTDDNAHRVNMIGNAALAALGISDMLLFRPVNARFGAEPIRRLPDETRQERVRKLAAGEALMQRNAERADQRYDWTVHAGNFAGNALVGGLTWAAGDAQSGIITIVLQTVLGELYIWTDPSGPAKDWQEYQRLRAGESLEASRGWSLAAFPGGVALKYRF